MEKITKIDDLRKDLDLHGLKAEQLPERFEKIAKALLTEFAIKKGEDLFYITDIEFYYYADDHKDFITYPRKCKAGEWFFHASGVDIAFESNNVQFVEFYNKNNKKKYKPVLVANAEFGGILIRSIEPADGTKIENAERLIDHPMNVSDFLFDHFDAFEANKYNRFPVLIPKPDHKYKANKPIVDRRDIKKIQNPPENTTKNVSELKKIKTAERKKKFKRIINDNYAPLKGVSQTVLYKGFTDYLHRELRYKLE